MLSAEAARLAAIECLSPTEANEGTIAFPTLAGGKIFDSRAPAVHDIDETAPYTPVVSIYSREAQADRRSPMASYDDTEATFTLEIVAELAVVVKDEDELIADAMAGSDPEARLVLMALCAQIRRILGHSEGGVLFRRFIRGIDRVEMEPYAVPELGLRWQRVTMRMMCGVPDDVFTDEGGLPEPLKTLRGLLPSNSYAAAKLAQLEEAFIEFDRTPLAAVHHADAATDPKIGLTADME